MIPPEQLDLWGDHLIKKLAAQEEESHENMHYYKIFLDELAKRPKEYKDALIAVCGPRGYGKSSFALVSALILRRLIKDEGDIFTMDNVCHSMKQLANVVKKASSESCRVYIIDEAIDVSYSRDALSRTSKALIKFVTRARKRRNIYFWCIPSFRELDSEFRNNAIHYWIEIFYQTAHSEQNKRYAVAGLFSRNMNPTASDKWGFDTSPIIKYAIHNKADVMKYLRRLPSWLCFVSFPALPAVIEDAYSKESMVAIEETGREFGELFGGIKKEEGEVPGRT
jgi:hypothetical protein